MAVIFLKDIALHHVLVDFSFSSLRAFFRKSNWMVKHSANSLDLMTLLPS